MESLTLLELNRRIASLVVTPSTQNVWVTAELSDVSVRGGHCYMELLQKDPANGTTLAKARAAIWANNFRVIRSDFYASTGQDFTTGLKVMVRVSVSMHPVYGMSMVINAVNPDYTMGDILRRRKEILAKLESEGIADINKSLCWPEPALRIAVISSPEAAGYGDFMNQIVGNSLRLRFDIKLFPAIMQGERTAQSVINALSVIESEQQRWDGVVIIRGGGATSDLLGFENYDLAAKVASFPLPVIVRTALQYLTGCKEQLSQFEGRIPTLPLAALERAKSKTDRYAAALQQLAFKRLQPQISRLDTIASSLGLAVSNTIGLRRSRLDALNRLLEALSPQATLRRGYSITRYNGEAVTSADAIPQGEVLTTTLADGQITSVKQ